MLSAGADGGTCGGNAVRRVLVSERIDVYLCYRAPARSERSDDDDRRFAITLHDRLQQAGLRTFLQDWDIVAGQSIAARIDEGIRYAENAIIVVSGRWAGTRLGDEYTTLAHQLSTGRLKRLVPVLRDHDSELPPTLDGRAPISFADVEDEAGFEERVAELVAGLRGERWTGRPGQSLTLAPDRARVSDEPSLVGLRVDSGQTVLSGERGTLAATPHQGLTPRVRDAVRDLDRARARLDRALRTGALPTSADGGPIDLDRAARDVGTALAGSFLPDPVALALATRLREVATSGRAVHLSVEVDDSVPELADLPWESLVLPGDTDPLVLRPTVWLHRRISGLGVTARRRVPGPLRVLVAISAPDVDGGSVSDYEHELARVLDQVEQARAGGSRAHVRILNWGSADAMRAALSDEDFHVLHISCRVVAGRLLLETPDGAVDLVGAERLATDVVVPGRVTPLVVLAGSAIAGAGSPSPGLARALLQHGVPSVLAMTTAVTDDYAVDLLSTVYRELARRGSDHDPLPALSAARRMLEQERAGATPEERRTRQAEWAAPVLYQRVLRNPLYDSADPEAPVVRADPYPLDVPGDRGIGDFVGRRVELRRLLAVLRAGRRVPAGVLVHGMGGVGKSSLAAELVRLLAGDRPVVAVVHGATSVDAVVEAVASAVTRRLGPPGVVSEVRDLLTDRRESWRERVRTLEREVLPQLDAGVLLVLDDPLGDPFDFRDGKPEDRLDAELLALLRHWLEMRRPVRLLITSRSRSLSGGPDCPIAGHDRVLAHHLGPLSWPETRKLMYRLPALDALDTAQQQRVHQDVGGHPRALEYFDALLRRGREDQPARGTTDRFVEVKRRIEQALAAAGDTRNPRDWWCGVGGDLDAVLAETVALASTDVLLDRLHTGLIASFPLAAELFEAASVYRVPVDDEGLRRVLMPTTPSPDPACRERLRRVYTALSAAERDGTAASRGDLALPRDLLEQVDRDLLDARRPGTRPGLAPATARLLDLTLLTPVHDEQPRYLVHRWTAAALRSRIDPEDLRTFHERAAMHHRGRAELWRRDRSTFLRELEEACHHSWAAGRREKALAIAAEMCTEHDLAGALDAERALCEQTLARGGGDDGYRFFHHRMSVVAMRRGRFDEAAAHQQRALDLAVAAGDLVAVAGGRRQLGTIAQLRGDRQAAEQHYREAVRTAGERGIAHSIGARLVLASCYQRLGGLALARADEDDAIRFSTGAIQQATEIGVQVRAAAVHADLAELARALGEAGTAEQHTLAAQEMRAADVDVQRLLAAAHLQHGAACVTRQQYGRALDHLRQALGHADQLRDVVMHATCLQLLGEVHLALGSLDEAAAVYSRFAGLAEELDDRPGLVVAHQQTGRIRSAGGDPDGAEEALQVAARIAEGLGSGLLVGTTGFVLGELLLSAGRDEEAAVAFGDALGVADAAGETGLAMSCVVQLALLALRGDDLGRALELFGEGAGRARALDSKRGEAVCLLAAALIVRTGDRGEPAADLLNQALALAEQDGNPRITAECLTRIADLARERGDLDSAGELYSRALATVASTDAADLRAQLLHLLGRCRTEQNDLGEAAALLADAATANTRLGRLVDSVAATVRLSRVLACSGRPASAMAAARRAGRHAGALPVCTVAVVARLDAAADAAGRGRPDDAQDLLDDAVADARALGDRTLVADAHCELAALARRRLELDDAIRELGRALGIARHLRDSVLTMHLHRELGLVRELAGDEAGARQEWERSAELAVRLADPVAVAAARACATGGAGADARDEAVAVAEDEFTALRWMRRLRSMDGETAFEVNRAAAIGPPVDLVVRELAPRMSGVSAVPTVVSPTSRHGAG